MDVLDVIPHAVDLQDQLNEEQGACRLLNGSKLLARLFLCSVATMPLSSGHSGLLVFTAQRPQGPLGIHSGHSGHNAFQDFMTQNDNKTITTTITKRYFFRLCKPLAASGTCLGN